MRTNFNHLKPYPKYYKMAIDMEEMLVEANNMTQMKAVGNAIRQIMEGLIGEVADKYKIYATFESFSYKVSRLGEKNIMAQADIDRLKKYFIPVANDCSHPSERVFDEQVEVLYEDLYRISYKIATYYLTDKGVAAYKSYLEACKEEENRKKEADKKRREEERKRKDEEAAKRYEIELAKRKEREEVRRAKREEVRRKKEAEKRRNTTTALVTIVGVVLFYMVLIMMIF